MKATDQEFHVILFIVQGGSNFQVFGWNSSMQAIEQYFHVVLFIML